MKTILRGAALCGALTAAGSLCALPERPGVADAPTPRGSPPAFWLAAGERESLPPLTPSALTTPMPYTAIPPCRLLDTRSTSTLTGAWGPPSLAAHAGTDPVSADRAVASTAATASVPCPAIPAGARAIAANVTAIGFVVDGRLTAYHADAASRPGIATVNLRTPVSYSPALAQVFSIVPLDSAGSFRVFSNAVTDLIVDVNGYYAPAGIVNSLNALTGDVTLAQGSNVTISSVGNTLTIAATGLGVASLTGTNGISASPSSGAVTVTSNATSLGTAGTIVARDVFNGFSVGTITLGANLYMSQTNAGAGFVNMGGNRFLHAFGTDNTFLGARAGNTTLSGSGIVGVGVDALTASASGAANTAVGSGSLKSLTDGYFNTAVGNGAMLNGLHGANNAALGISALSGTNGNFNVGVGANAITNATAGNENVGLGANSLNGFTSGSSNVAVGYHSGTGLVSGSFNIYVGPYLSPPLSAESNTIRVGTGNQTRTFIAGIRGVTTGQSNGLPVVIDSNGQLGTVAGVPPGGPAGGGLSGTYPNPSVNSSTANTGLTIVSRDVTGGFDAGTVKLSGDLYLPVTDVSGAEGVVAVNNARFLHSRGTNNTFLGTNAGTTGLTVGSATDNAAVGFLALGALTTGNSNVAVGSRALQVNAGGNNNVAVGYGSLSANTSGLANVAIGTAALSNGSAGTQNVAVGNGALQANGWTQNTAVGTGALINGVGQRNTAVGAWALQSVLGGDDNIAIGSYAGMNLTGGAGNIYVGSPGSGGDSSVIRIGSTQTATFIAGIYGTGLGGSGLPVYIDPLGKMGWTSSSRRYKDTIDDIGVDSDVVLKLRPVSFFYKADAEPRIRQYGLIAEEVAQVAPGLAVLDKDGQPETVRYQLVNALLLNEVQNQRKLIEALEKRLAALEAAARR